ncbi:hypothetical protein BP5796_08219 [Coleophoma crateriformis]|uniref:Uncharacterized protein n=1 Tax=Coleophoma crateriformis TaxID=565419 RepID=A0A3D8RDR8_9HELO|nr:hypothetical protein BP5796_08219 [Coleophoma crateriformis]
MDPPHYARPPTPQALLHRAPDKPEASTEPTAPKKYIILILAPTSVAGKVQIATSVSQALACPLFQGDSLHESSAKAAAVGASRSDDGGRARYQRMWMSKMTRTGLLFPEESRPATEGFSGFGGGGGGASTSTSRRGSASSVSSSASFDGASTAGSTASSSAAGEVGNQFLKSGDGVLGANQFVNKHVFTVSEVDRRRALNPALMVLTHPELEPWHREAIRGAVGEYGIGVIFVPLFRTDAEEEEEEDDDDEEELPVLRPLDPRMISGFTSFDALKAAVGAVEGGERLKYGKGKAGNLEEEMVLEVDVGGRVEDITEEVVKGVEDVMLA